MVSIEMGNTCVPVKKLPVRKYRNQFEDLAQPLVRLLLTITCNEVRP